MSTERIRKLRTWRALYAGRLVLTEDGERWTVASTSSFSRTLPRTRKWVWLQRGNAYRQLRGSAIDTLRVVITRD